MGEDGGEGVGDDADIVAHTREGVAELVLVKVGNRQAGDFLNDETAEAAGITGGDQGEDEAFNIAESRGDGVENNQSDGDGTDGLPVNRTGGLVAGDSGGGHFAEQFGTEQRADGGTGSYDHCEQYTPTPMFQRVDEALDGWTKVLSLIGGDSGFRHGAPFG